MKRKLYAVITIATVTLFTGCGNVTIGLKVETREELLEGKESLEEAKQELNKAREEIQENEDITEFERSISNMAIDVAEYFGIGVAEKYVDYKLKGED